MTVKIDQLTAQIQAAAKDIGEPAAFTEKRLTALQQMNQLSMPKMQEFSYDGWPIMPADDQLQLDFPKASAEAVQTAKRDEPEQSYFMGFAGSQLVVKDHDNQLRDQGVFCGSFAEATQVQPEILNKYFMSVIKSDEDRLTAYHAAFVNGGALIYVPRNVTVAKPIEVRLVQDSTQENQPLVSHLLIVAAPGSKFSVMQHLMTVGDKANSANLMVEVVAQEDSEVHFSTLDELSANTTTYHSRRAHLDAHANVEWAVGLMNDGNTLGDLDSELLGEGSKADSKLIAVTEDNQHVGINNRVTNRGLHTTGLINQRGVVLDSSQLIFNGIGQIVHGAHGSNAEQQNRLLMMGKEARGDANPILLIDENDVDAGHAASVGQVDANQMYYLLSRGIPEPIAQRMVIRGFLSAVLTVMPTKELKDKMLDILERKLGHD